MIEVQDLHKSFGKVRAVRGVSFRARDARITGLLGPNGAGKSTTLRVLYTLIKPDKGRASVDSHDVMTDALAVRGRMGVLPHNAGLYPRLSARENIEFFGRMNGLKKAALKRNTDRVIEMLEIGEFATRRAKGFSQGQRIKVALARAMVHEPRNILLDEPTNGLDVMATRSLRTLIRRLRDEGKCVLFSSHVMQEVAALCDEIVIIGSGRVVAAGTPDQIRRNTGEDSLEDAFVRAIGSEEGLE
ncbi:MAG: ATP-binding cassette domain-containing protein [Gammaproteobacteria bacterium]|nr:ATP-binding cassette domain-containing protein [Gammaproteobacteria bacterium]